MSDRYNLWLRLWTLNAAAGQAAAGYSYGQPKTGLMHACVTVNNVLMMIGIYVM
jgi:hypothetical protein